ncbi:MAG: Ig-like domain-containing protein [Ruminococcus sp.]|nr:Ig-like domain-containing protein [Ruminococcus sp.]
MNHNSMFFRKSVSIVLSSLMIMTTMLVAGTPQAFAAKKKYVKSIKAATKKVTLAPGKSTRVKITVKVKNKASKKFKVKSSNKKVASAKVSGSYVKITAGKSVSDKQKAVVTVTTNGKNKKGKKLVAKINVTTKVTLKGITLKSSNTSIEEGGKVQLKVSANNAGAKISGVTYSSSDDYVATVNGSGVVTGQHAGGPVTIKAVAKDSYGNTASASVQIRVTDKAEPGLKELEKIKVTADPTTISVGGTSNLTVVSDTDGVDIERVEYRSDNDYIATVNSAGVVSGQHSGIVPIIVTAYDKSGNSASATVNITVNELIQASIKGVDASAALYIGETKALKPIAIGSNEGFIFSSDNEKVATVSSEGVITAVSKGTAKITVRIAGTNASAVCVVSVKDSAPGIKSFTATHAQTLKLEFTAPINADDRELLNVAVTKGDSKLKTTLRWSDDGTYVEITTDSDLEATTYNVTISSDELSVDINKNKASCTVEPRELKAVKIKSKRIPKANNVKIYFDALDNYGDPIPNVTADKFNWGISSSETAVNVTNIRRDESHIGYLMLTNLASIENLNPDKVSLTFKAEWKDSPKTINDTAKVDVVSLNVQSIKLEGFVQSTIVESSSPQPYTLKYEAKDQYGDDIDWSLYLAGAYNNEFRAYSSNTTLVSVPQVYEGQLVVYVGANQNGTATISVTGNDLQTSYVDIEVLEAPKPVTIKFDEDITLIAKDSEEKRLPVTFVDQYGNDMTTGSVTTEKFKECFGEPRVSSNDLVVTYRVIENRSYLVFNAEDVEKPGNITISYSTYDGDNNLVTSSCTIKVNEPRKPDSMRLITNPPTEMVIGQEEAFDFEILDNHGSRWTGGGVIVELETSNRHYISPGIVDVDDTGLGTMSICAENKSEGAVDDLVITFRMYDENEYDPLSDENVPFYTLGTEYHVKIYDNFDEIKTTTDYVKDSEVKSGLPVQVTLELYNKNNLLTTYNHSYNKVPVNETIVEKNPDNTYTTYQVAVQYIDINFVNGKATFTVQTNRSGDISFSGFLPAIGKTDVDECHFHTSVTEPIKVVANDVVKYETVFLTDEGDDYIAIFALDKNNNVNENYNPDESTYVKLTSTAGDLRASDYINGVDAINGYVPLQFYEGCAFLKLDKAIPVGVTLTINTGDDIIGTHLFNGEEF